jgi:hypothetical protein
MRYYILHRRSRRTGRIAVRQHIHGVFPCQPTDAAKQLLPSTRTPEPRQDAGADSKPENE